MSESKEIVYVGLTRDKSTSGSEAPTRPTAWKDAQSAHIMNGFVATHEQRVAQLLCHLRD